MMRPADTAFARGVHERVLNTLHLLMLGKCDPTLLRATLDWIDDPEDSSHEALGSAEAHALAQVIEGAVLRSGVAGVDVDCPAESEAPLEDRAAAALADAIVEALRNSQRHADATRISVLASRADGWIHVQVSDDGRGFDAGAVPRLGLGLGITQAMADVAGTAEIRATSLQGTHVLLSLPEASTHGSHDYLPGCLAQEWPMVARRTRRLLDDLVAGRIDGAQPCVIDRARIEDGRIRAWLDAARTDSWLAQQVAAAVSQAADQGHRLEATIIGQAGLSAALDIDLGAELADADSIMLTVAPDSEELLVVDRGNACRQLAHHPELPSHVSEASAELRITRIVRGT